MRDRSRSRRDASRAPQGGRPRKAKRDSRSPIGDDRDDNPRIRSPRAPRRLPQRGMSEAGGDRALAQTRTSKRTPLPSQRAAYDARTPSASLSRTRSPTPTSRVMSATLAPREAKHPVPAGRARRSSRPVVMPPRSPTASLPRGGQATRSHTPSARRGRPSS